MKKLSLVFLVILTLCATAIAQQVLPQGCTSAAGYSPTTGVKCDSVQIVAVDATVTVPVTTLETKTIPAGKKTVKYTYKDDNCDVQTGKKTVRWDSRTVVTGTSTVDQQVAVKVNVPVVSGPIGPQGPAGPQGPRGEGCEVQTSNGVTLLVCANSVTVLSVPTPAPVATAKVKDGRSLCGRHPKLCAGLFFLGGTATGYGLAQIGGGGGPNYGITGGSYGPIR